MDLFNDIIMYSSKSPSCSCTLFLPDKLCNCLLKEDFPREWLEWTKGINHFGDKLCLPHGVFLS